VDFSNVVSIFGKGAYSSGDVSDWTSSKGKWTAADVSHFETGHYW